MSRPLNDREKRNRRHRKSVDLSSDGIIKKVFYGTSSDVKPVHEIEDFEE